MIFRTNSEAVLSVLGKNYDTSSTGNLSLVPFMRVAHNLTDRTRDGALAKGITLTTDELLDIETWLSCHFYTCSDPMFQSRAVMGVSATFQGQTGKGLEASSYGMAALAIDYSNTLKNISNQQVASMTWLGKPLNEQIDYDDRN